MALHEIATISTKVGELEIYQGHEPWIVDQLIIKSRSERLTHPEATPRDAAERFVDHDSFNAWVVKGEPVSRKPYVALDMNRRRSNGDPEVAKQVWLGGEPFPADKYPALDGAQANHTYAVRAYGLEGGVENGNDELEAFYAGPSAGGTREFSAIAVGHYAATYMQEEAEQLATLGLEPAIHLETGVNNPALTGMYPHMLGPRKGFIKVGTNFNERHQQMRAGMVLPMGIIAASGYMHAA